VAPLVPVIGDGMRRRTLFVVLAVLAMVVAAGAVVLWPRAVTPGLTQENFDRVRVGMMRPEVEAILGPWCHHSGSFGVWNWNPDTGTFCWVSDDGNAASVRFDDQGTVKEKASNDFLVESHGPFDTILWRAKRQWHRWFPE
jgi:hypothetical protein